MAYMYSMHVVITKTELFYDHIFQKFSRMHRRCVGLPGPSPGDEAALVALRRGLNNYIVQGQ